MNTDRRAALEHLFSNELSQNPTSGQMGDLVSDVLNALCDTFAEAGGDLSSLDPQANLTMWVATAYWTSLFDADEQHSIAAAIAGTFSRESSLPVRIVQAYEHLPAEQKDMVL